MKCNVCERSGLSDLKWLRVPWGDKSIRLHFCGPCVKRGDLFEDATPKELIDGHVQSSPIPTSLYRQYLTLTKAKAIKRIGYDIFIAELCSICLRNGLKITVVTNVAGEQVLLRFCDKCTSQRNIFLDYTPLQVFESEDPTKALFLTPNFTRYITRSDKNVSWHKFRG